MSDEQAAAMPLTSLTAYELLFDKLHLIPEANAEYGKTLLIINGAGGVGSILIQLAKWIGMTVIASASRPETIAQVKAMGADFVVNHRENYVDQVHDLGFDYVPYIILLHSTERHFDRAAELVAPLATLRQSLNRQKIYRCPKSRIRVPASTGSSCSLRLTISITSKHRAKRYN